MPGRCGEDGPREQHRARGTRAAVPGAIPSEPDGAAGRPGRAPRVKAEPRCGRLGARHPGAAPGGRGAGARGDQDGRLVPPGRAGRAGRPRGAEQAAEGRSAGCATGTAGRGGKPLGPGPTPPAPARPPPSRPRPRAEGARGAFSTETSVLAELGDVPEPREAHRGAGQRGPPRRTRRTRGAQGRASGDARSECRPVRKGHALRGARSEVAGEQPRPLAEATPATRRVRTFRTGPPRTRRARRGTGSAGRVLCRLRTQRGRPAPGRARRCGDKQGGQAGLVLLGSGSSAKASACHAWGPAVHTRLQKVNQVPAQARPCSAGPVSCQDGEAGLGLGWGLGWAGLGLQA